VDPAAPHELAERGRAAYLRYFSLEDTLRVLRRMTVSCRDGVPSGPQEISRPPGAV